MSRSYRKPYATVTGNRSAKDDKRVASRCLRRKQNDYIRSFKKDWDEFLLPVRHEAPFNDPRDWGRDGKQWLHFEPNWADEAHWFHCHLFSEENSLKYAIESFERAQKYYKKLCRK